MALDQDSSERRSEIVERLSIYGYPQCPFCRRVMDAVDALGLEIPLRDTLKDAQHRRALADALGRTTVPVLRIEQPDGEEIWMPESADIVRYLQARFGRSAI